MKKIIISKAVYDKQLDKYESDKLASIQHEKKKKCIHSTKG